ncbi:MAG: AAA family ATPase [Spirochaetaceae bacterium]|nr:AAA family ATPase [Spirochaetaceae bacterium]
MFLKSLDIFGFKSFADKTHIEFADGITALLGPNGCGKSNVVDAIKWVLGEQKSGALRAEKMEDVIFNGTETRKALGVAEVTLTLANDNGILPIDMPEVQIKRRLYRSGESEYSINSQERRLKEIRELFWDTGVGKAAYSVMEQGKIDQALSSKPEERRYLFEEAAGITSFKVKTHDAELKIAKHDENIRQVEALLKEVKRNYDTLKVQAEKTIRFRALRDEIFSLERDIQLLRLKQSRDLRDERGENVKLKTLERDALRQELEEINRAVHDSLDDINALEQEFVEKQKTIFGLAKDKEALANEVKLVAEQQHECKNQINQNENKERSCGVRIEELRDDADEQDGIVRDLRKKIAGIEENIASFEENIKISSSRIGENEETIRVDEAAIKRFEEKRAGCEGELETITDDIVAALDAGLKEAGYSSAERRRTQAELENTLQGLDALLKGKQALLGDIAAAAGRGTQGGEDVRRAAESLAAALGKAAASATQASALFAAYCKSTPTFIDEFLAPEGIITKKRALDGEIRACKDGVLAKREHISALRQDNEGLGEKIAEYRQTLHGLQVNKTQMQAQAEGAESRASLIRRQLLEQEALLKSIQDELFLARKRRDDLEERISSAESEIADIDKRGITLGADLEKLEKDIERRNKDVSGRKEIVNKKTEAVNKLNQQLERLQVEFATSEHDIENIQENFRETHSRDLLEFEERIYTITDSSADLKERLNAARGGSKELGSINYGAPEEFEETKERYDFLTNQMDDLQKARTDLENIAAETRAIASERFMANYNRIKTNFHNMFRRLFGGGQAQLRLSDPNHVLESGIEIFAQPPGKKLENITLLSGGEKSMTAVALLFATYMVKPSPFCFLDEIDAALDEDNVSRFVQLLREFGSKSQFIIITHNKKTVTGAATLLGVTMEEKGVTKTIAIRLQNAPVSGADDEAGAAAPAAPLSASDIEDEEIPPETGMELPRGIDDPEAVSEAELRPLLARNLKRHDEESER